MDINNFVLRNDEKAIFALRSLYEKYGYSQFKMSKFEEYDLYVRNKDFLVSDNIITFTDTSGKLMALKPDVTLSIIKNSDDKDSLKKVYYNENVYRVSKGSYSFKEIMQVGLECIGDTDEYCIYEVLSLAAESLNSISPDFALDISHLGIISEIIDSLEVSSSEKQELLKCIGDKNTCGITAICGEKGENLKKLTQTYGNTEKVISVLDEIFPYDKPTAVNELISIVSALEKKGYGDKIKIDFSVLNDMNYYSGIVFRGFINGIPTGILSGGQYDNLMKKMKKKSGAIGFAVYLDMLERLNETEKEFDVDSVILYNEATSLSDLRSAVDMLTENGKSVIALKTIPENLKYNQLFKLQEKGALTSENNA
ncbi:MAG: hypothetical protein E7415_05790 [Ruminococcaceae bacterium]|nr:hypothetical protein [Oscillospiraceae bacterium]